MSEEDPIFGENNPGQHEHSRKVYEFIILGIPVFRLRFKPVKPELDPLEVIRKLLEDFEHQESIDKSKSVAGLHRVIENTHARRRLEKWSQRVIGVYLLVVLGLIIATYLRIPGMEEYKILDIPDNVMIAILTTTTANIIGLGLIVLRGHFLSQKEDKADNDNN